ncbi:MAG: hypothetical protein AAB777_01960, partial [Patescibacteria group bacterium]
MGKKLSIAIVNYNTADLTKKLLESNPLLFLSQVMPASTKKKLSAEAQINIETEKVITGTVDVLYIDDFKNPENSRYKYFLNADGNRYNLYTVGDLNMVSDTKIKANGYVLDNDVVINTDNNNVQIVRSEIKTKNILTPDSVGNQRTLVLLIKAFPGDSEPFTPAQGHDLVFNGQFQKFMQEQSYGNVSFSGDVYGWVSLGQTITSSCMFLTNSQLLDAINNYHIDLRNYDRLVYLLNGVSGGCSEVGKWQTTINNTNYRFSKLSAGLWGYDQPSSWGKQPFTWTNLDHVVSHEMGHSLGVVHANGWECLNNQTLYGDCQHIEYGNYFDTMGSVGYALDYNAYFKESLGWLQNRVLSISKSGEYSINPLELNSGIAGAKIKIKSAYVAPYYLEYRKGIGFDSNLNDSNLSQNQEGLFVNRIQDGWAPATELLDMSPISKKFWDWRDSIRQTTLNSVLSDNSVSFNDPGRGITIGPILNVSSSAILFRVNLIEPTCSRLSPLVVSSPNNPFSFSAGSTGYVKVNITKQDYIRCDSSNFDISSSGDSVQTQIL